MAWSRLQSALSAQGSGTSQTVTFATANLTAGTKIIAAVLSVNAPSSVATPNGTLTSLASVSLTTNLLTVLAMDTPAADAGTKPVITATFGASQGVIIVLVQEVSGLATGNTTAMLDGTAGANTGTIPSGAVTTPAYSSTAASEYLTSFWADSGSSVTLTAPAGYTADASNWVTAGTFLGIAYKNSANGAEAGGWTTSAVDGANTFGQILVAFGLAGAGVSATVTMSSALAVTASQPAPQMGSLTSPAYATAFSIPVAGTGTWVNPGSAGGPPDGSYATWAVV